MSTFNLVIICVVLIGAVFGLCSCSGNYEKPDYSVLSKADEFEIRQYQPYIIAETVVDSDFQEAGNVAFRRLFNYISGENVSKESIKMTAPVEQRSEKIKMTAPVEQRASEGKFAISFVVPSKYNLETVPQPVDSSIVIRQVPEQVMVAVRYSGGWGKKSYDKHKVMLEEFIQQSSYTIVGDAVWARYDPPFQLSFFRRNEILIPVE